MGIFALSSQELCGALTNSGESLPLRASRRGHLQARGWRLQGNSWRHGKLLQIALRGGLGPQKALLESSWRALGGSLSRLGGSWRALGASWARWGRSWRRPGRSWGGPGAYKRRLGGSPGRLGAVLGALEAMLEPSEAPKMERRRVSNRTPEATRT